MKYATDTWVDDQVLGLDIISRLVKFQSEPSLYLEASLILRSESAQT